MPFAGARGLFWALSFVLLASPGAAFAHAPPQVFRIVWKNDQNVVLVTNRGLMFGGFDARKFRLTCNEALGINSGEQTHVAYRKDGALLAATSNGLFLTQDDGCTFEPVAPLVDMFVPALAQHPSDADTLLAATFGPQQSALRATYDGGKTWSTLSELSDRDYTYSLLFAPQDPQLVYASGTTLVEDPTPTQRHYSARSSDGGKTWERTDVVLNEGELNLTLLSVNPVNSAELLARAASESPGIVSERLLVSDDSGRTFRSPASLPSIEGAAFSEDGQIAWAVGSGGVWRAGPERAFERIGTSEHLSCVDFRAGQLWMCGHFDDDDSLIDGVGQSRVPPASPLSPAMVFTDVTEPVACDITSLTPVRCDLPWKDFHSEVFAASADAATPMPEAGMEPAGPDAGAHDAAEAPEAPPTVEPPMPAGLTTAPGAPRSDSGCAIVMPCRRPAQALFALVLCLALRLRRRLRNPQTIREPSARVR